MLPSKRKGAVTSAVDPTSGGSTASPVNSTTMFPLNLWLELPTPKLSPRYVTSPRTSSPSA